MTELETPLNDHVRNKSTGVGPLITCENGSDQESGTFHLSGCSENYCKLPNESNRNTSMYTYTENKKTELENLSENMQIGGKVKIRTKKGISTGNFTILGYSLRSNEYTLQSLETGELVTIDKKNIITKFSSLEDPNKLKISDDIKLDVDELPAIGETFKLDIKDMVGGDDDDESFADDQWYPKQLTDEELTKLGLDSGEQEDEEVRTVEKISTDDTDKNLRVLAFKEEEKDDDDIETDKSDVKKTTIN